MENPEDAGMKTPGDAEEQQSEHVGYSIENFNNCENIPDKAKVAFFTYGRFQPGHRGHEKMILTLLNIAIKHNAQKGIEITPEKTNIYVFVSPSGSIGEKDPERNPLTPNQKVDLLLKQYKNLPIHFVNMGEAKAKGRRAGPGGAVTLLKSCYSNAVMFVGGDRIGAFDWLGNIMNIEFEGVNRPENAMSATAVRNAATAVHQTRLQDNAFKSAIQFGAVTRSHVNEIKRLIRAAKVKSRLKQLKLKKSKRASRGGKRKTRKRRKTRRRHKRKRRKTRKRMCRFR